VSKYALQMKLDPDSERAWQQAATAMLKATPKDAAEIVREGAIGFVQAARKMTPKARKSAKREIVEGDKRGQLKRYGVVIRTQGQGGEWKKKTHWLGYFRSKAQVKNLPIVKVPRVGAAKNSWWGALKDVDVFAPQQGRRLSTARKGGGNFRPFIRIENPLEYITKIAPGIEEEALRKAAKAVAIKAEKALAKKGFK
jgi:hypothetical protein